MIAFFLFIIMSVSVAIGCICGLVALLLVVAFGYDPTLYAFTGPAVLFALLSLFWLAGNA